MRILFACHCSSEYQLFVRCSSHRGPSKPCKYSLASSVPILDHFHYLLAVRNLSTPSQDHTSNGHGRSPQDCSPHRFIAAKSIFRATLCPRLFRSSIGSSPPLCLRSSAIICSPPPFFGRSSRPLGRGSVVQNGWRNTPSAVKRFRGSNCII